MEMRTLRYFVVTAQELNITRAAARLKMSQPPLSNQIKSLEAELGVKLFIRGKRHLQLTSEGNHLYRRVQQILELVDKTQAEFAAQEDYLSGTISLSMVEGRAPFLSARWIAGFSEEYPQVRFSLWSGSNDDVVDRLHLIAAPYDTEHLGGVLVGGEPWVAVIPRTHPLAQAEGQELPVAALAGQPLIAPNRRASTEAIYRWFEEAGCVPNIRFEVSRYMDAVALVEQQAGICICPQTTGIRNDLVVSKILVKPARKVEYVLVWRRGELPSRLAHLFRQYVKDFIDEERIHLPRFRSWDTDYPLLEGAEYLL